MKVSSQCHLVGSYNISFFAEEFKEYSGYVYAYAINCLVMAPRKKISCDYVVWRSILFSHSVFVTHQLDFTLFFSRIRG